MILGPSQSPYEGGGGLGSWEGAHGARARMARVRPVLLPCAQAACSN